MKTVLCGFYHIYLHTTRCHFTGNERKKGGAGSFWSYEVTIDTVAMAAASAALVTLSHHGTVTMGITLHRFPHEADITISTAERRHGRSMACEPVSSAHQEGNKYISYSQPPPPDHPPGFLCAHTCVKLKLSWPYIWLRMLFLWLKRFICWSISGDTLSRFAGGGVASTMATRCCHMYRRWCQLTETATEPTQIGVCMRVGASTQTCLWVSVFIRGVGRNPIMTLSVRIHDSDSGWRDVNMETTAQNRGCSQKAFTKISSLTLSRVVHLRLHPCCILRSDWL